MNKTTLIFPDPNASFQFYLRREEALRKHAAQKTRLAKLRTLTTSQDRARTPDRAGTRIEEISKPGYYASRLISQVPSPVCNASRAQFHCTGRYPFLQGAGV